MDVKKENQSPKLIDDYPCVIDQIIQGNVELFREWEDKIPASLTQHFYSMCFPAEDVDNPELVQQLLGNLKSFAYIESYHYYSPHVPQFVDAKIAALKQQKRLAEERYPDNIFDLQQRDEALFCFYLIRNLIRRNDSSRQADLLFLMHIPSVKALIQTEVNPGYPNELMHLAFTINNEFAQQAFFDIFSVHFLEEEIDFSTLRRSNHNIFFDYICEIAKELNRELLLDVKESNLYNDSYKNGDFPHTLLARLGEDKAVELLVEIFKLSRNQVTEAYARGGHVNLVNRQLALGINPDYAASGYAARGDIERLKAYEACDPHAMLYGFSKGGFVAEANKIIAKISDPSAAVCGNAQEGRFQLVNQQIAAGSSRQDALEGYLIGCYVHMDNILRLMAVTDDDVLRKMLAHEAKKIHDFLDVENLYTHATQLNQKLRTENPHPYNADSLFETIYQHAVNLDKPALIDLVNRGVCLGVYKENYTPLMLLAKNGNHDAVMLLLEKFQGNINHAAQGYAEGGFFNLVNAALADGASSNYVALGYLRGKYFGQVKTMNLESVDRIFLISGYAEQGNTAEVNALIKEDVDNAYALYGYILGGHDEAANLLLKQGAKRDDAIEAHAFLGQIKEVQNYINAGVGEQDAMFGFARRGNVDQVNLHMDGGRGRNMALYAYCRRGHVPPANLQIEAGGDRDLATNALAFAGYFPQVNQQIKAGAQKIKAVKGYEDGYFLTGHAGLLLRLMTYTEDKELRRMLAEKAQEKNPEIQPDAFTAKAEKINMICQKYPYQLGYKEAQAWAELDSGSLIWILQGLQLVKNKTFLPEVFWIITQFVIDLPSDSAMKTVCIIKNHLLPDRMAFGFFEQKKETTDNQQISLNPAVCSQVC